MQLFMPMLREGTLPFGIDFANRLKRSTRPSVLRQTKQRRHKSKAGRAPASRHRHVGGMIMIRLNGSIEHLLLPNSDKRETRAGASG